jgi:hypothetical protein
VNKIRSWGFVVGKINQPGQDPNALDCSELILQLRWRRRVLVERRVLKVGKGINGSWGFAVGPFAKGLGQLKTLFLFLVYERLDSESPNRSPSMVKRLPRCKPEPVKLGDRESRQKKTSSQAAVPQMPSRCCFLPLGSKFLTVAVYRL